VITSDTLRTVAEQHLRSCGESAQYINGVYTALTQAADYIDELTSAVRDVHALLPAKVDAI